MPDLSHTPLPPRIIIPNRVRSRSRSAFYSFSWSRQILFLVDDARAFESTAPILKLSSETLTRIYESVGHPRSQIALALSCKTFAGIARGTNLRPGLVKSFLTYRQYVRRDMLRDLRRWQWIPSSLQLCRMCWKYLPRQRVWKDKRGRKISSLKKVDWVWAVKDWLDGGHICPSCRIPEGYDDSTGWLQCCLDGFGQVMMVAHEDLGQD